MLRGNIVQQNASITKTNPKHAWKTVSEILGRSQKQDTVNEIKLPEKTVTSTRELVNVFNDYFTHVGPKLAEKIEYKNRCSFRDFIPQHEPVERFTFQPVNVATIYRLITKLNISKATGCSYRFLHPECDFRRTFSVT